MYASTLLNAVDTLLNNELSHLFKDEPTTEKKSVSRINAGLDISSDENNFYFELETPGMEKKDITVKVEKNVLTVSGEKKRVAESDSNRKYHRVERSYGSFMRKVSLPETGDATKLSAKYENGVLNITLPKKSIPEISERIIEL